MAFTVQLEGLEGQHIEVRPASLFAGPRLLINGSQAPRGSKRGEMVLRRNDGSEVIARWKPQLLGLDTPKLLVNGKTIPVVEPLKTPQIVWGGLPVLLFFVGGALGAAAGIGAFSINARIFRSDLNAAAKYLVTALVSVGAVFVYALTAAALITMASR
jgi:hypothetical protein